MLCERCKIREANIKYTEVINGVKTEHNLCSQCAKDLDFGQYSAVFDGEFPLGRLLSGLLGLEGASAEEENRQEIACPTCGTTYEAFIDKSRFGCPDCYRVFDLLIGEKIKKMQGNDSHTGKRPKFQVEEKDTHVESDGELKLSKEEEIRGLERKLREALRFEEYETAAKCRDEIRALKAEDEDE